ncbi:MAG: sensor histidine kinase, partial [Balneolales bacterium]
LDRLPNAVKRALDKKKTERQRDELVRKLEASLKEKDDLLAEKDALIQEVHHRVKNNLSIITSLLNIQAGFVSDRKVKALLIESVSRIRSMGMVHEMIYDQTNFSNVVMETYIIKLFQFISINFADPDVSVRYDIDARDVFLNINVAMPCALILNELITNAYKHAFRGRRDGEIKVSLSKKDNNRYDLKVSDNGVGLPEEADDSTLGLSLVHGLVNQIQGTVSIERNGAGTTYVITFAGAG